jgi:hypothetical protein
MSICGCAVRNSIGDCWRHWPHRASKRLSSAELFGFGSQPSTLIVRKSDAARSDLPSQRTIFFDQIFNDLPLPLIHPTSNRNNENSKWI